LADDAVREFSKVVELHPDSIQGWIGLGGALHMLDRLDEAEVAFRKALEFEPDNRLLMDRLRAVLEDKVERRLFELGYLSKRNKPLKDLTPYEGREPIKVEGKPLSETIIEER
jgi:tetratricopeptide (TPR) repeat protein